MLYIGSCRYMRGYEWNYFPARLHTTKEIIYFLENIDNITNIINNNPQDLTNKIFGDIYHPSVIDSSTRFLQTFDKNIKTLILEISSRKIFYYNNIPLNYYYVSSTPALIDKYNLKSVVLNDIEIENDLENIICLSQQIFHKNIEVHVIPHLNLRTHKLCDYIPDRNIFVNLLEQLCIKKNIHFHNIGKYIENIDNSSFIEDYMSDSTHYSRGYDLVKRFLIENIQNGK